MSIIHSIWFMSEYFFLSKKYCVNINNTKTVDNNEMSQLPKQVSILWLCNIFVHIENNVLQKFGCEHLDFKCNSLRISPCSLT